MKINTLSIASKILSIMFIMSVYIISVLKTGTLPSMEQVQGVILLASFISAPFLPVDISKIITNIKGKKE